MTFRFFSIARNQVFIVASDDRVPLEHNLGTEFTVFPSRDCAQFVECMNNKTLQSNIAF